MSSGRRENSSHLPSYFGILQVYGQDHQVSKSAHPPVDAEASLALLESGLKKLTRLKGGILMEFEGRI